MLGDVHLRISKTIEILTVTIWRGSCLPATSVVHLLTGGGLDGMSEVQRNDAVGAVLGFLSRVLRLEMPQLRRDYRPHDIQESAKEPGDSRSRDCCRRLERSYIFPGQIWCRESFLDIHRADLLQDRLCHDVLALLPVTSPTTS
jgi:hypothetical protein